MSCHSVGTNFCKVPGDHPKIKAIKQQQESKVHGRLWFDEEQDVEAKNGAHDDEIADNSHCVANFIQQQKPLVYPSVKRYMSFE